MTPLHHGNENPGSGVLSLHRGTHREVHIPVVDVHTMDLECLLEESSMVDLDIGDQTKDSKENLVFDLRHLVTVQKICTSRFD